jgi:hypothetical protein
MLCSLYCFYFQRCNCCPQVRLSTSDLKAPLRAAQSSSGAAAAAAAKLAEQQAALQQQLDGCQQLIGALQAVAAKQFKVRANLFGVAAAAAA